MNSKNLNMIKRHEVGLSFKCNGRWSRNQRDWIKDQGSDPVEEVEVMAFGRVLRGLRNTRSRVILWTGLRQATRVDALKQNIRRFVKREPLFISAEELGL